MKIETEMDAGGAGHFLIDNQVQLLNILEVRVLQSARYVGSQPGEPVIEYLVTGGTRYNSDREQSKWVPQSRAGKTKAELLAKLW